MKFNNIEGKKFNFFSKKNLQVHILYINQQKIERVSLKYINLVLKNIFSAMLQ